MSSEWDVEDGDGHDMYMYRDILENEDDEWDFDALNEDSWSPLDDPTGVDLPDTHSLPQEPPSSSTFDGSSPPRPSHDSQARHNISRLVNGRRFGSSSPARIGTSAAVANNDNDAGSRRHASPPRHRPQVSTSDRQRPRQAEHSEHWLDQNARRPQNNFGNLTERLFDPPNIYIGSPGSLPSSDGVDIDDFFSDFLPSEEEEEDMPVTRRRRNENSSSVVDLTQDSSPPSQDMESTVQPRSLKRGAEQQGSQGRASKRSRPLDADAKVEELDLTNEAPSAEEELIRTQQQAAILAQESSASGPLKIGKRQCIICMEAYTNATITHCGHIYCHECLTQALLAGEKNSERGVGSCPVCRKSVSRKKANHVIPVSFMKKSAFRGKARRDLALLA